MQVQNINIISNQKAPEINALEYSEIALGNLQNHNLTASHVFLQDQDLNDHEINQIHNCQSCQMKANLNISNVRQLCIKHSLSFKMRNNFDFNRVELERTPKKQATIDSDTSTNKKQETFDHIDLINKILENTILIENRKSQIHEQDRSLIVQGIQAIIKRMTQLKNFYTGVQEVKILPLSILDNSQELQSFHQESYFKAYNNLIHDFTSSVSDLNKKLVFYMDKCPTVATTQIQQDLQLVEFINQCIDNNRLMIDQQLERVRNDNIYCNMLMQAVTIQSLVREIEKR